MSTLFLVITGVLLSSIATLGLNSFLGGAFVVILAAYYFILFLIAFLCSCKVLGLKKSLCAYVALIMVCCSIFSVRVFQDVEVLDRHQFSGLTLLQLDRFLWDATQGRVMLQYTPQLRDWPLIHNGSVGDDGMSLDQFKSQLESIISGSELVIKSTGSRPGYFDFAFRSRGYHFLIGHKVLPSELKAVD